MGLFDSVLFECPDCSDYIEVQSKAGECSLTEYPAKAVPVEIAKQLEGNIVCCQYCNKNFTIERDLRDIIKTRPMILIKVDK